MATKMWAVNFIAIDQICFKINVKLGTSKQVSVSNH